MAKDTGTQKTKTLTENRLDDDPLIIGGVKLRSRLIVGTGKYKDFESPSPFPPLIAYHFQ